MYPNNNQRQCLICGSDLNDCVSLYHLIYQPKICICCMNSFEIINKSFTLQGTKITVLYHYNDFFKKVIFQYKGLGDYALKDVFIYDFIELKKQYSDYIVAIAPSSNKDNHKRNFCPNEGIANTFSKNIFTGLYKKTDYKQTSQSDRSLVSKVIGIENGYLLSSEKVLIFDDVITSGNTILTCINLIRTYSPKSIEVLILASNQINNLLAK